MNSTEWPARTLAEPKHWASMLLPTPTGPTNTTCSLRARNSRLKTCWSWRRSSWTGEVQSKPSNSTRSSKPACTKVTFEGLLVAALDFVGQQQSEEGDVVELLGAGQRQPLGQGGHQRTELEAFEQAHQIGINTHGWVSGG